MSKLIEVTNNITDGVHGDCENEENSGYYFISVKDLEPYNINYKNARQITYKDYVGAHKRTKLEKGDVLFANSGDTIGKMLQAKYLNVKFDRTTFQKSIAILKPNSDVIDETYFYYLIKYYTPGLRQAAVGSAQKNLLLDSIRNFIVKINHSLPNQKKAVRILELIDSKIELNNRINAELEAMAKTLYDYWFVQFDFPDAKGKPYKTSGGKMVWNEELKREVPEGWEVKRLFDTMDVQYGFPFDTLKFTDDTTQKPVVRIRDILENTISTYSTEEVQDKYRLCSKDLLIGMDGNFHLNFWDKDGAYLNQRSVRIRSRKDCEVSNFQALFELTPYIKAREKNVSRTTVGHLSDKDLKRLFLIIPVKTEKFKPKKIFDNLLQKIISNRLENQQLSSLRDWLLPMLMNGQVTVKDIEEENLSMAAEPEVEYKKKKTK